MISSKNSTADDNKHIITSDEARGSFSVILLFRA